MAKKMRAPLNDKADGYKEIGESHQKEVEGVFKMRVITYQSRRGRGEDLPSMLSAARNPLCLLSRCSPAHDGIFRKMDYNSLQELQLWLIWGVSGSNGTCTLNHSPLN